MLVLAFAVACRGPAASRARSHETPGEDPPTTDGALALANLDGQIAVLERDVPQGREPALGLVELLLLRGQIEGRIADSEKAATVAEGAVRARPDDPNARLARGKVRLAFHRFRDALQDVDAAERGRGDRETVAATRAAAFQGAGRYEEAVALRRKAAQERPGILTLGGLAGALAERGDVDEAEVLFAQAIHAYRDVSPFPVAWIDTQRGTMWLRAGDLERARSCFAAAVRRLARHAPAATNLGWIETALGHRDRGIERLRAVARSSDDPEAAGILAAVLPFAGEATEAAAFRQRAAARYDDLLARHPEAFADHAARFWLGAGADPRRALTLAQRNLENRRTPGALVLVVQAARAANENDVACRAAEAALAFGHPTPPQRSLAERAVAERLFPACSEGRALGP